MKDEERAVIVDRVAAELNQWSIRDEIQAHLTAACFFDLLEAAERSQREADKFGHRDYEEEMRWIAETLRDAIRRAREGK